MMNVSKILGRRNILFLWVLGFGIVLVNSLNAQNVTMLLKGKVIDEAGNALQGVNIQFKDGESSAGKTKSQNNGEFSFVLKPGKTYAAFFDRKKKGKNVQPETQLSFGQLRIKALIDKLISIGTSESRIQLIEGTVKAPNDIQVTVKDIDSSF